MQNSKLYIVSTPIGNLADMTFRAVDTLKKSDLILAEDTRQTLKLLNYYNINVKLLSYHKFNEKSRIDEIIDCLENGKRISLVSDAGTPLLSDPGYVIVKKCIEESIDVEAIPGASSILPSVLLSGFDPGKFLFLGFMPKKTGERESTLKALKEITCQVVFFESPNRVLETLKDISEILGDVDASVAKELTKIHEQVFRGKISTILQHLNDSNLKGEFTITILARSREGLNPEEEQFDIFDVKERVDFYIRQGKTMKEAIKSTAEDAKMKKSDVYKIAHNLKIEH